MTIALDYGDRQAFRYRAADITIRGKVEDAAFPVSDSRFSLNQGPWRALYVEAQIDRDTDWLNGYKDTPAELRCRDQGEFCVEFSAHDPELRAGENTIAIEAVDAHGTCHRRVMAYDWDPTPPSLPLDLRDLTISRSVQEIGQAVNGVFDLDPIRNVIRSRAPVAPDALFVIGPLAQSQEATYAVRFLETQGAKWLGCSDFFAGLTEGMPGRGIKVGWISAGMAAMSPRDGARSFLAWGDHSGDPREWAIATNPATPFPIERNRLYRVRHQTALEPEGMRVRWRIWPAETAEPGYWLCEEDTGALPVDLPRPKAASFGLFQHMGCSIEWSQIELREMKFPPTDQPCQNPEGSRQPFLKRDRPGAF